MTDPDPQYDTVHPSGHLMFRSCRGGYLHSVVIGEAAMDTGARALAEAILMAANVSYLKAERRIWTTMTDLCGGTRGQQCDT